jgi:hypothetical protein
MRVIFSRKGFDSAAGEAPSPIIGGEPTSLPIPTELRSETTYRLANPMFSNGRWAFGQTGAAQAI